VLQPIGKSVNLAAPIDAAVRRQLSFCIGEMMIVFLSELFESMKQHWMCGR
jgi:hypothetical protein